MFDEKKAALEYKISSKNTFTLSAATKQLHISDLKGTLRSALYWANGGKRVATWAYWFGDGLKSRKSRSFHVAVCRDLTEDERLHIQEWFREVCVKEKWGNPYRFFQWDVTLEDEKKEYSTNYLEQHDQKWFVKISTGPKKEVNNDDR